MKTLTKRDFIKLAPATVPVAFLPSAISGLIAPAMAQGGVGISFDSFHDTTENKMLNVVKINTQFFASGIIEVTDPEYSIEQLTSELSTISEEAYGDSYLRTLLITFLESIFQDIEGRKYVDLIAKIAYIGVGTRIPVIVVASIGYIFWFETWGSD